VQRERERDIYRERERERLLLTVFRGRVQGVDVICFLSLLLANPFLILLLANANNPRTAKLRINKNTLGNSCGVARSVEGTVGYSERVRAIDRVRAISLLPLHFLSISLSPPPTLPLNLSTLIVLCVCVCV
jgi:hypothetical protein